MSQARPTAIVTGASRGLGAALAHELAAAGWDLVLDARGAAALAAAADQVDAAGGCPGPTSLALPGDIADPRHVAALVAAADALGGPDLLVNNAGTLGPSLSPTWPMPTRPPWPPRWRPTWWPRCG